MIALIFASLAIAGTICDYSGKSDAALFVRADACKTVPGDYLCYEFEKKVGDCIPITGIARKKKKPITAKEAQKFVRGQLDIRADIAFVDQLYKIEKAARNGSSSTEIGYYEKCSAVDLPVRKKLESLGYKFDDKIAGDFAFDSGLNSAKGRPYCEISWRKE